MLTSHDNQIAAFLARQPYVTNDLSAEEPQVIFKGALELDRTQEEQLVQAVLQWRRDLAMELGRNELDLEGDDVPAQESLDAEGMPWMQSRNLWDLVYRQRMGWRRRVWQGIYQAGQNLHFPLIRRTVHQMIARAQNYFFQTEPWCSALPIGLDADSGKTANEWAQYKFDQAKLKATLEKSIELAMIRGECVCRVAHSEEVSYYEAFANVAADEAGNPIEGPEGVMLFEDDNWIPDPSGAVVHEGTGIQFPAPPQFVSVKVNRKHVQFSGPEVRILNYRDFMAPLTAESLEKADCTVWDYEMTAIQIVEQYIARATASGIWDDSEYPQVLAYLHNASAGGMQSTTGANSARSDLGETTTSAPMSSRGDPLVKLVEACIWFDANNDGKRENVYVLIDLETERPILYDYVENVFEDKRRPYRVVKINPIDGRWYGESAVEMFWPLQKAADLTLNRWDFANSTSGSVTKWNPHLTKEGVANPKLKLNAGTTLTPVNQQVKLADIVERVQLAEFKGAQLEPLLQYYMQMVNNISGVANGNDQAAAGLETVKTATGVRNLDRSGQEQFAPMLSHLDSGITDISETALFICVERMDEEETFAVMGPEGTHVIKTLRAMDIRRLKWALELELTRYRAEQEEQMAQAATSVALEFYMQVPQPLQGILAPLYRQRLKSYGVRNVDSIIAPLPAPLALPAEAAQGTPGNNGSTPSLTATP